MVAYSGIVGKKKTIDCYALGDIAFWSSVALYVLCVVGSCGCFELWMERRAAEGHIVCFLFYYGVVFWGVVF